MSVDTSKAAIEEALLWCTDAGLAVLVETLAAERDAALATIANQREIDGRALASMRESDVLGLWWQMREKYRGKP